MKLQEMAERLSTTEAALEGLKKELRVVKDIEEIKQLHISYVNSVCFAQYDDIADYFAEDATIDFGARESDRPPIKGKANIQRFFNDKVSKIHVGKEGTFVVHPLVSVDGDKAKGKFVLYFFYYHPKTYQTLYFVQSWLDMDYVKEDGKWKISGLGFIPNISPPGGAPNEDSLLNFLDEAQQTMRGMQK